MIFEVLIYLKNVIAALMQGRPRYKETIQQLNFVANESLVIVLFCVGFAAMVTILESSYHMKLVIQNDSMVPGFASMLILRELGAVVTCLLIASRVGAGFAAEIGIMKTTEQIEALKMLNINPFQYLVVPRLIACAVGGAVVTVIANIFCLLCSALIADWMLGFTWGFFVTSLTRFVDFQDLVFSCVKGFTFGAVIPLVAGFQGMKCKAGAEGVGMATTQSVVVSSILIIVFDFILSYTFSFFY